MVTEINELTLSWNTGMGYLKIALLFVILILFAEYGSKIIADALYKYLDHLIKLGY